MGPSIPVSPRVPVHSMETLSPVAGVGNKPFPESVGSYPCFPLHAEEELSILYF